MDREKHCLQIYRSLAPFLFSTARRILNDKEEAEECMQDAFVKLFSSPLVFTSEAARFKWLHTVNVRNAIDRLRHRKHKQKCIKDFAEEVEIDNFIEQQYDTEFYNHTVIRNNNLVTSKDCETVSAIKQALAELPDGYRAILSLYLFEGYDFDEIASIMKIKPVSVRSQYSRGRQKLQAILKTKYSWMTH